MSKKIFIIAEAGVNHNGSFELAKKLIDVAAECDVDAVKFQTWKTELLVTKDAKQAEYQTENTQVAESQFDMLKKLELSYSEFSDLKKYCDLKGVMFMSTPDEFESAKFLSSLQDVFKIGSGELTNLPFLSYIGGLNKKIVLSTGMGSLEEVGQALKVLVEAGTPLIDITVLHATTEYPTQMSDVNLKAMLTIRDTYGVKVGYSDHTKGITIPIAASAMGAQVIEKHFTLDCNMHGPDHKASIEPHELKSMVQAIRHIEVALGDGIKRPTEAEMKNIPIVRKSLVARKHILKGDVFSEDNVCAKRPGTGKSPMMWKSVIGTISEKEYFEDELL